MAPASITFDSAAKATANSGVLTHGQGQPVWGELTVAAGPTALKTTYALQLQGQTT